MEPNNDVTCQLFSLKLEILRDTRTLPIFMSEVLSFDRGLILSCSLKFVCWFLERDKHSLMIPSFN